MTFTQSIYIEAPVEKVFDFYKDPRNQWATMPDQMMKIGRLTDVKTTQEGVGTYSSWTLDLAGLRVPGFDVVIEYVPNRRITSRSSRSFVGTFTVTFEPEGSGTRCTMQRRAASFWALGPIDQLTNRVMGPSWHQSLEKLKAALEAPEPAVPPAAAGHSEG